MTDLWPRLTALLGDAERPARYINHEWGCTYKPEAPYRFCMVYPDTYELGQANQAIRILCNVVNEVEGMAAERAFLPAPEFCDIMREHELPLFSLESCAPLAEFDAVGITLPHELAATNVLETLSLSGIPLHAEDRGEHDPFVFAGGPCAFNPEPYAPFFDAFSIGEGEESVPEMLSLHRSLKEAGASRQEILRELVKLDGCYVPSLYDWACEEDAQANHTWIIPKEAELPLQFTKRLFEGFAESPGWEPCVVPFAEAVHDRLNVEILRGCTRGCRFCQAGMMYRPVRERSADNIVESVIEGLDATG
ncbi:MAG: B12-binding domain-containing radical SAM protein, partial [Raoultibacter sp.]